jgi:hypothetical protein
MPVKVRNQMRERKSAFEKRSRLILAFLACAGTCMFLAACNPEYSIEIVRYDPSRACNGVTIFQDLLNGTLVSVNMEGEVLWDFHEPGYYVGGQNLGFDVLEDGKILFMQEERRKILDPSSMEIVWEDQPLGGHHSVSRTARGTILFLNDEWFDVEYDPSQPPISLLGDVIQEVDAATGELVWEWHLKDHVDPVQHHDADRIWTRDWSHCNTVRMYPDYEFHGEFYDAILLNSRRLFTFWMIDSATGEILWSCGEHGTVRGEPPPEDYLFTDEHDVFMFEHDRFIMYDNGDEHVPPTSRALEIEVDPEAGTENEVWSWTESSFHMYDFWGGDANRLPNGNTLVANVTRGRLVEVTPAGETVWEMVMHSTVEGVSQEIYKCERIPYDP